MRLKRNLRAAREAAGKTVVETARAVEKSRQAVSAWERFDPNGPVPSDRELEKLAALFHTDVMRLRHGNSPIPLGPEILAVGKYLQEAGYISLAYPALAVRGRGFLPDFLVYNPDLADDTGTVALIKGVHARTTDDELIAALLEDGYVYAEVDPSDPQGMAAVFPPTARSRYVQPTLPGIVFEEPPYLRPGSPRHARNLPLAIREYLAALQLRLTKGGASEEEVSEAMELLRSPQLFTFYKGGAPSEYNEEDVLSGMRAIAEGVIVPVLRERGRKIQ